MKRCIKNHCIKPDNDNLKRVIEYSNKYNKCKNLFYNLYYNDPHVIFKPYKFELRDSQVEKLKNNNLPPEQLTLLKSVPAKLQKCALQEVISDVKSIQSNRKLKVFYKIKNNCNLSAIEKEYLLYVLKSNNLLNCIISGRKFKIFKFEQVDHDKLNNRLARLFKLFKIKRPFSKHRSFTLDGSSQITYIKKDNDLFISIPSVIKNKKILFKLTDKTLIFSGDVKVVIKSNRIEFHKAYEIKQILNINPDNDVYVSIGLLNMLTTENSTYGKNFNVILDKYNTNQSVKNLETLKKFINSTISTFIVNENPTTVIMKNMDQDFINKNHNVKKIVINKVRRIIKDCIEYKFYKNDIQLVFIHPAYTDKICSVCGSFDTYNRSKHLQCKECTSSIDVDMNIIDNIKNLKPLNIGLHNTHSVVKRLLVQRKLSVKP